MNPEVMKMAMEQMANMSPDQMANMKRMAENCSPTQIAEAQRMMGSMSPSQMADMQRQAAASGYAAQQPQQALQSTSQAVKGATTLKEAGNKLHQAADYTGAMKKYSLSLEAIKGESTTAALALVKACNLNLGACALKTKQYDACVQHCSNVLQQDRDNHKALYRRGKALLENGAVVKAEADLARAIRHAPAADRSVMQPTLDHARSQLLASPQAQDGSSVTVEDVTEEAPPQGAPPPQPPSTLPAGPQANNSDANQMRQYAEMMRAPGFAAMTENMVGNMSQLQLDNMAAAAGAPCVSKEQAVANMRIMKAMTPEQMAGIAQQQNNPGLSPTAEQLERTAAQLRANPEMLQQSMDMMRTMPLEQLRQVGAHVGLPNASPGDLQRMQSQMANLRPEDISRLASQGTAPHAVKAGSLPTERQSEAVPPPHAAASSVPASSHSAAQPPAAVSLPAQAADVPGGMPNGGTFSPEMLQMASRMMGSMTPDQMAAVASMAGGGSGKAPTMGADGMPQLSPEMMEQMQSPEMMAMAKDMMKNMDPTTLASMMKQSGMDISPEQAGTMKQQLDSLSPRQMWWLMTTATGAQRAVAAARRTRDYLKTNPQIAAAVIITLILVLLRWLDVL